MCLYLNKHSSIYALREIKTKEQEGWAVDLTFSSKEVVPYKLIRRFVAHQINKNICDPKIHLYYFYRKSSNDTTLIKNIDNLHNYNIIYNKFKQTKPKNRYRSNINNFNANNYAPIVNKNINNSNIDDNCFFININNELNEEIDSNRMHNSYSNNINNIDSNTTNVNSTIANSNSNEATNAIHNETIGHNNNRL